MIKPHEISGYEVFCDNCKKKFGVEIRSGDNRRILTIVTRFNGDDGSFIRKIAEDSNWQIVQDSDLCPDCWNDSSMEVKDEENN